MPFVTSDVDSVGSKIPEHTEFHKWAAVLAQSSCIKKCLEKNQKDGHRVVHASREIVGKTKLTSEPNFNIKYCPLKYLTDFTNSKLTELLAFLF
jgi:hypothetical protein